jgi:hypothetical protein
MNTIIVGLGLFKFLDYHLTFTKNNIIDEESQ